MDKIVIANVMGFMFLVQRMEINILIEVIFSLFFDLQDQCFGFWEVFFRWFFFGFGCLVIFLFGVHYIFVFLGLEFMLFSVFLFFGLVGSVGYVSFSLFFFLLVLVCMGGFGISLLVFFSRCLGRDFWIFKFLY
jgi:hypothetical protein